MTNATKKELLAIAKEINLVGRHNMTRDELDAAITEAQTLPEGNYIPTTPWRGRPYSVFAKNEEVYATLPPQAKKIFDFMEETGITARGSKIVEAAIAAGYLKTTQDHAVLFAFYARKLEDAGIRLVG